MGMYLLCQPGPLLQAGLGEVVEEPDHPAHTDHGQHRAQTDAKQQVAEAQADDKGADHAERIKAVLAQAKLLVKPVRQAADDAVAGVGG